MLNLGYSAANVNSLTQSEIAQAALSYVGQKWDGDNCTGLVWAVSESVTGESSPFWDAGQQHVLTSLGQQYVDDLGYVIPPTLMNLNNTPTTLGLWTTIKTSSWQTVVQVGDFVRIPDTVYLGPTDPPPPGSPSNILSSGHSFIVVGGSETSGWDIVDNAYATTVGTDPVNNQPEVTIAPEYIYPDSGFGMYVLNSMTAFVSQLTSASLTNQVIHIGPNDTFSSGSIADVAGAASAVGANTIDGGFGHTTVELQESSTNYQIAVIETGLTISGGDQATPLQLMNVEDLQFTDKSVFVESGNNENIALLYSAALNRAPDSAGLFGWESGFALSISSAAQAQGPYAALAETPVTVGGATLPNLAYGFTHSQEFQSEYGALSNTQFVTLLYQNVLGRAPDSVGLSGWLAYMTTGDPQMGG